MARSVTRTVSTTAAGREQNDPGSSSPTSQPRLGNGQTGRQADRGGHTALRNECRPYPLFPAGGHPCSLAPCLQPIPRQATTPPPPVPERLTPSSRSGGASSRLTSWSSSDREPVRMQSILADGLGAASGRMAAGRYRCVARRIGATRFVGHGRCICITSRTATTSSTSAAQEPPTSIAGQSTAGPGDTAPFTKQRPSDCRAQRGERFGAR